MALDYLTRADLLSHGQTRRSIQAAVRRGELIHVRRDRYLRPDAGDAITRAVRVGGRLTCLSLLALLGVFVLDNSRLHVQVDPWATRLRFGPHSVGFFSPRSAVRVHWERGVRDARGSCVAHIVDAVIHAVRCQAPRAAIATLDSALHLGLIGSQELAEIFEALPARFRAIRPWLDGRAESGPESLVRIMAHMLGCSVELQVDFDGIGRVDLVLDGWLVVECDSKEFHSNWAAQARDRERDAQLAALGYPTLRLTAAMVMYRPDDAFAALSGLVKSRRP